MKIPNYISDNVESRLRGPFLEALAQHQPHTFESASSLELNHIEIRELHLPGFTSRQFLIYIPGPLNGERKFFLKKYISRTGNRSSWQDQLKREFAVEQALAERFKSSQWFKVAKPYFIIPEEMALVTEFIDGLNLQVYFFKALRFSRLSCPHLNHLHDVVRRIGNGLAELQAVPISEFVDTLGPGTLTDYLNGFFHLFEEAEEYLQRIEHFADLLRWARQTLKSVLIPSELTPSMCYLHGDFIQQNFIIDGESDLNLIDFASATLGPGYLDAADFVASLEDISYLRSVSKKCIKNLVNSFLLSLGAPQRFDPILFDAFRVFVQLRSTMMILKAGRHRSGFFRRNFYEDVLKRCRYKLTKLLQGIEHGRGELNYLHAR